MFRKRKHNQVKKTTEIKKVPMVPQKPSIAPPLKSADPSILAKLAERAERFKK